MSAATGNTGLTVQVTAVAACTMSTTAVNFPTYVSFQAGDNTATGGIDVNCPTGVNYSLSMDGGINFLGNPRMNNTFAFYLNYGLYSDMGYTISITSTQFINSVPGTGFNTNYPVYGKLFSAQYADTANPNYSDFVTVTINY